MSVTSYNVIILKWAYRVDYPPQTELFNKTNHVYCWKQTTKKNLIKLEKWSLAKNKTKKQKHQLHKISSSFFF